MRPSLVFLALVLLLVAIPFGPSGARGEDDEDLVEILVTDPMRLEDLLKAVGRVAELPLYWDSSSTLLRRAEVVGARNLKAPRRELFSLVRSLLASYDLVLVPVGPPGYQIYRVMDVRALGRGACLRMVPAPVQVTDDTLADLASQAGVYVTTTLPVSPGVNLDRAAQVVGELATANGVGQVIPLPEARALLVNDFAPAVVSIYRAVRELDAAAPRDVSWAHQITLEHLDARTAARAVGELLMTSGEGATTLAQGPVRVAACEERKALLVEALPDDFEQVEALVRQLDVPAEQPTVWTHVVKLEHIGAEEAALALEDLLPIPGDPRPSSLADSVRVVAHGETNNLLVTATPRDFEQLKAIIDQLDRE